MARRPPHLRWIYAKDHAPLFSGLALLFVLAMVVAAVVATDPTRGLLLGVIPILAALVTWALTNRAGYPNRGPVSLPPERPTTGGPPVETWDPFERERPAITEPEPAPSARTEPGDTSDAHAEATSRPSGDTALPNLTEEPSAKKAKDKQESRSARDEQSPPAEKASTTRTSEKPRRKKKTPPPPAGEQSASQPPSAPPTKPGPEAEAGSEKTAPAKGQKNPQAGSTGSSPKPKSSDSSPPGSEVDSETSRETLSPAEAAIRDAEARKRKKRKGTPTEVA
jgi:hypothetical protein